jgi:hypothetical protein
LVSGIDSTGLVASSGTLAVDLNGLSQTAINTATDSIVFIDGDDNSSKKETISAFLTDIAGAGIIVSGNQLTASGSATALDDIGAGDANAILTNTGGFTEIKVSGANRSNAIVLTSNSGVNETIEVHNIQGTGASAINIVSHGGGVVLDGIAGSSETGNVVLKSTSLYPLDIGQNNSGSWNIMNTTASGAINFITKNNAGHYITGLVTSSEGDIGIGTSEPGTKLNVYNGSIQIDYGGNVGQLDFFTANTLNATSGTGLYRLDWEESGINDFNVAVYMYDNNTSTIKKCGYFENSSPSGNSFNFTGQHRCLSNKNLNNKTVGLIVSTTNNFINIDNTINPSINESLPYCKLSNTDNDKKVFGVISNKEDTNNERNYGSGFVTVIEKTNDKEQRLVVNSLGEGAVWVCNKNGNLENGDYITSTTVTGYGGKQTTNEGLLTNYTVAKITCDCNFSLTKIVKQKLKVTKTTVDGVTTRNIDYDENGNVQCENDLDEEGNSQLVYPKETRFLQADGTLLNDESDYTTRLNNGETVYIACFVGCTYHCG